jgi:hypothetical protein
VKSYVSTVPQPALMKEGRFKGFKLFRIKAKYCPDEKGANN